MSFDPLYASAHELLDLYRRREVSPVEVVRAQLSRADAVDDKIGAFIERMDGAALAAAAESERRYRDGDALPLDGITVAAKEKHAIAGHRITEGSLAWDGWVPTENHPIIDRLLAAGAVIHARTATPEFSIATYTHTRKWGITRNPWHLDSSPGGSSGGAGAALAAGLTTLATASDIGGSTRGPAAFTGTVGYKAPYGRIPGQGATSLDYYRGDGPLARTVDDALLMTNVISGQHRCDQASLPKVTVHAGRPVKGMRIAFSPDLDAFAVDPEVAANTRRVIDDLAAAGADVQEVRIGWDIDELRAGIIAHFAQMMAASVAHAVGDRIDLMSDYAQEYVRMTTVGRQHLSMFDAVRNEYAIQQALGATMVGFDALVCPTTAAVGFPAGDTMIDGITIDDKIVNWSEGLLTLPFNVNNRCPVLAVPSGFAANGMPTGVQLVGHPYDDDTVFSLGAELERRRGALFSEAVPAL
ncbi:amidase [Gordonia hydrophobica]|uniref:amidase n=1 Tax=Gordonia hydrophobica TaxID=40516 RepID=A0ABZ2U2K1_9ACTN|nr:amidase [Gordonia hydrophobica]MBM7366896.1 aspartyl-tRNA(Asn)/glutamyl-tRNA(Gln) amidotransferase subunit A [Gordonia hydrophobica]